MPHRLTENQTGAGLEFCRNVVAKYGKTGQTRLKEVVTGDESWTYFYDPETKLNVVPVGPPRTR